MEVRIGCVNERVVKMDLFTSIAILDDSCNVVDLVVNGEVATPLECHGHIYILVTFVIRSGTKRV